MRHLRQGTLQGFYLFAAAEGLDPPLRTFQGQLTPREGAG
jgi:hypothetical protein